MGGVRCALQSCLEINPRQSPESDVRSSYAFQAAMSSSVLQPDAELRDDEVLPQQSTTPLWRGADHTTRKAQSDPVHPPYYARRSNTISALTDMPLRKSASKAIMSPTSTPTTAGATTSQSPLLGSTSKRSKCSIGFGRLGVRVQ